MSIGSMRHRVTLQKIETTVGAGGEKTESLSEISTIWAEIEPKHHQPQFRGDQLEFPTSHLVTTRYSSAYMAAQRIVHFGKTFTVKSIIDPDKRKQRLQFRCIEGAEK